MMIPDFFHKAVSFVEDPVETVSALVIGFVPLAQAGWQPQDLVKTFITIIPAIGGVWVAHRSLERTHEYRMAKLSKAPSSTEMQRLPADFSLGGATAKPEEKTVDLK